MPSHLHHVLLMNVIGAAVLGALFTSAAMALYDFQKIAWRSLVSVLKSEPTSFGEQLSIGIWYCALGILLFVLWQIGEAYITNRQLSDFVDGWYSFSFLTVALLIATLGYYVHGIAAAGARHSRRHPIKGFAIIAIGGYTTGLLNWSLEAHHWINW